MIRNLPLAAVLAPERSYFSERPKPAQTPHQDVKEDSHTESNLYSGSNSFAMSPMEPQTPEEARTMPVTEAATPEALEAGTPIQQRVVTVLPSLNNPPMNKWRVMCACLTYFANGMNDGAPGALIPYLEKYYDIGYAIVSLIFITMAVGFIMVAVVNDAVHSRLGRARTLMLSEIIMACGYLIIVCTPPFGAVVFAFLLIGLGYSFNLALNNIFVAGLDNGTVILGVAHGCYGIGGLIAPLIATSMLSNGILWSRFFLITLALRLAILPLAGLVYRGYENEPTSKFHLQLETMASRQRSANDGKMTKMQLLRRVLRKRTTLYGALFTFAYQGAEVSISGWVISYLITARGGDPAEVGYVTSGFWGGITLGRFVLTPLAQKIGERGFTLGLTIGSIGFQLLVWFVPNIIGNAIAVSLLGLLLGPVSPCSTKIFARLLPSRYQVSGLGFISSGGWSGGAIFPFLTGLLAQAAGTFVLHPICIALFCVMIVCWLLLPKENKRDE